MKGKKFSLPKTKIEIFNFLKPYILESLSTINKKLIQDYGCVGVIGGGQALNRYLENDYQVATEDYDIKMTFVKEEYYDIFGMEHLYQSRELLLKMMITKINRVLQTQYNIKGFLKKFIFTKDYDKIDSFLKTIGYFLNKTFISIIDIVCYEKETEIRYDDEENLTLMYNTPNYEKYTSRSYFIKNKLVDNIIVQDEYISKNHPKKRAQL